MARRAASQTGWPLPELYTRSSALAEEEGRFTILSPTEAQRKPAGTTENVGISRVRKQEGHLSASQHWSNSSGPVPFSKIHVTLTGMAINIMTDNYKHGKDMEKLEHSYTAGGTINCTCAVKIVWQVLKKWNTELPYHAAILPLGRNPRVIKTYVSVKTCSQINIHSGIIYNSPQMLTTQMSMNWWMKKTQYIPIRWDVTRP